MAGFALGRLSRFSTYLGYFGSGVLFLMMLMTTCDVVGRYCFNKPILGSVEITEFMIVTVVFSFLGFTQKEQAHVAVDLVAGLLPVTAQRFLEIAVGLISLALMIGMTWMTVDRGLELMEIAEYSGILKIPVAPFYFVVALGCAAMSLELLLDLLGVRRGNGGGHE